MSYLQYMGVAVVISFVRALETDIPLGGNSSPRWLRTGVKKGGYMMVNAYTNGINKVIYCKRLQYATALRICNVALLWPQIL